MIHDLFIATCTYYPKSNDLLSPYVWHSLYPLLPPHLPSLWQSPYCCLWVFVSFSCSFICYFHLYISDEWIIWFLTFYDWLILLSMIFSKSIHAVANGKISSFLMAEWYSIVYVYHIFFIQLSLKEQFISFHVLAIVNNEHRGAYVFVNKCFQIFSLYPEEGMLGHMVTLFLIFWDTSILFSIMAVPVYIPTSSEWGFLFLHNLSSTCYYLSCW